MRKVPEFIDVALVAFVYSLLDFRGTFALHSFVYPSVAGR